MFNIIKTDFYIMKGSLLFVALYNILFPLMFHNTAVFVPILILMSIYVFIMGVFAVEERDGIQTLHKTLPVKAESIVGARYVEMLLIWLPASALQYLTCILLAKPSLWDGIYMLYSLTLAMFFLSFSIPVTYKYGQVKSRIPVMLIWIVGSVGISPLIIEGTGINVPILGIAAAVFAVLTVFSWRISTSIYKKMLL